MKRSNLLGSTSLLLMLALAIIAGVSSCKKETVEPETPVVIPIDMTIFAPYQGQYRLIYNSNTNITTTCCWTSKIIIKDNQWQIWKYYDVPNAYMMNSYTMTYKDNKVWIYNYHYIYKCEGTELIIMDSKTGWYYKYEKF